MATYPYAFGCGPDPKKTIDKYWKYENADPSTAYYATIVANEILPEIQDKIGKRGEEIYDVRPDAILVQDLRHEVIRKLVQLLNEHVKVIEIHEQENSGDISNYIDSENEPEESERRRTPV